MVCFEVLGGGLNEFLEGFVFDVGGAPFGDDVAGEIAAELHGVCVYRGGGGAQGVVVVVMVSILKQN